MKDTKLILTVVSIIFAGDTKAADLASNALANALLPILILGLGILYLIVRDFLNKFLELYKNRSAIKDGCEEIFTRNPKDIDDASWKEAYDELANGIQDKALWAKLHYKHKGDESRSKTEYVMSRARNLSKVKKSFESNSVASDFEVNEGIEKTDAENLLPEQVRLLVIELRNLGCEVEIKFLENNMLGYVVATPKNIKHSGHANEWELEKILVEVI
jgi:hypothetical protein